MAICSIFTELISRDTLPPLVLLGYHHLLYDLITINSDYPNVYIEMGKSDLPLFLETFPEVKIEFSKWANANIARITGSCDSVAVHLGEKIVPKIYKTTWLT